ncbi:MAG: cytochrome c oxidase subunit 3 family protein, partial [Rhizobacter sp.]|nr:cytochrome c oxidase subunit 3 family protein [Rhizobacter sp.]
MSNASEAAAPHAIGDTPSGSRPSAVEVRQDTHPDERQDIAQLGMWIFIASEVLFFGGLLMAYLYGRSHWPEGFAAASRRTDVVLGSINTALLLTSSAFAAVAVAAAEADRRKWVARCLWVTAALGVVFLAIKGMEWNAEWS